MTSNIEQGKLGHFIRDREKLSVLLTESHQVIEDISKDVIQRLRFKSWS